jgi:K(+)-stimulated pyrophosphate-energized sodium pump
MAAVGGAIFEWGADMDYLVVLPALVGSVIGLLTMLIFQSQVLKKPVGSDKMKVLAEKIHKGAVDFLITEYKFLFIFVIFIFVLVTFMLYGATNAMGNNQATFGVLTAIPLLVGSTLSAFAGWRGMKIATQANVRTTAACDPAAGGSINEGLRVAFKSGAVMGLGVTGLGLFGISITYLIYMAAGCDYRDAWQYMSGFGFGASCIALFARVGGGVYTKAADVGADLVGKVENSIPEDDPRNPAVIADLVGDNVGDCAGRGADLFESISAEIIGAMLLGASLATSHHLSDDVTLRFMLFPLLIHSLDMLVSTAGVLSVRVKASGNVVLSGEQLSKRPASSSDLEGGGAPGSPSAAAVDILEQYGGANPSVGAAASALEDPLDVLKRG